MSSFLSDEQIRDLYQEVKEKFGELLKGKNVQELTRYYEELVAMRDEHATAKNEAGAKAAGLDWLSELAEDAYQLAKSMGYNKQSKFVMDYSILVDAVVYTLRQRVEGNGAKAAAEQDKPKQS